MRDAHSFRTLFNYGAGYNNDNNMHPTFPPFTPQELNTTDDSDLGKVIMDAYGNIYMKVRYVQTSTAGQKGMVVCYAGVHNSITAEPVVPSGGGYSNGKWTLSDSTTTYTANQLKGSIAIASGSTANAKGIMREIYSNTATSSNTVTIEISKPLNTVKSKINGVGTFDANSLTSTASQANTIPTAGTEVIFARPTYDVRLASLTAANTKIAVGVLLGDVTAATASATYCTWIQIYGIGLVKFVANDGLGNNNTAFGSAAFVGNTAGCATAGSSTALTDVNIGTVVGYWLISSSASGVLHPVFICPFIKPV